MSIDTVVLNVLKLIAITTEGKDGYKERKTHISMEFSRIAKQNIPLSYM